MSAGRANLTRKWIPMVGGSCDVRMGADALERAGEVLGSSVGRPRLCMAVVRASADEALLERLRRQLVDAGFEVAWHRMGGAGGRGRSLAAAEELAAALADAGLTSDDLCCAMGDDGLLSVASYVCGSWCGGMSLVAIPTDEVALLEGALSPGALCVGGRERMVAVRPCAKHVLLDYDMALSPMDAEPSRYLRTLMVAAAMAASEREFSALWDRAGAFMGGDEDELVTQLLATAKSRGQMMASTAAAVRQGMEYGQAFAYALAGILDEPAPRSVLVAEGLRFSARLAVLLEKLSIDDMLAQDELLQQLGIGELDCAVAPDDLVGALKRERFERTNRFMLPVPLAIGRVRLTTVEDDVLGDLAGAWCAAHGS